jgi:hypothetical protein
MIGAYDKGGTSLIYWNDDKFGEVLLDDWVVWCYLKSVIRILCSQYL